MGHSHGLNWVDHSSWRDSGKDLDLAGVRKTSYRRCISIKISLDAEDLAHLRCGPSLRERLESGPRESGWQRQSSSLCRLGEASPVPHKRL